MTAPQIAIFRIGIVLFLAGALGLPAHASDRLLYQNITGDTKSVYAWSIEKSDTAVAITVHESDVTFVNRCLPSGETVAWSQDGRGAKVEAVVTGGKLRLTGVVDGKPLDRTEDLDGLPWLQPLSYSLQRLVAGHDDPVKFWTIRPDTMEPVKLEAEYKGHQALQIGDTEFKAFRVRITPPGMLSVFWHGDYWYREGDGLFLKYEGMSGPPGSPKTRVTLVEEPVAAAQGLSG